MMLLTLSMNIHDCTVYFIKTELCNAPMFFYYVIRALENL